MNRIFPKRSGKWRAIAGLFYRVARQLPYLACLWIGIPLLLGALIIPSMGAQKQLVDFFVGPEAGATITGTWMDKAKLTLVPLLIIIGLAVVSKLLNALQALIDLRVRDRASLLLQADVHKKGMRVPLSKLDQPAYYDRLRMAQSAADTEVLSLLQQAMILLRLLFEVLGAIAVVWIIHPVLGGLLSLVMTVSVWIRLEADIVKRRLNRDLTRAGRQADYMQETMLQPATVRDMRIARAFSFLANRWTDWMSQSLILRGNANRREIRRGIMVSTVQITGLFGAILWLLAGMKEGEMTPGTVLIVFQAIRQAYGLASRMAFPLGKIYIQSTKIEDLAIFLAEPDIGLDGTLAESPDLGDDISPDAPRMETSPLQVPGTTGRIAFEKVSYRYFGTDTPVLHELTFALEPGETVALVGENGAGKSTLVKLLLGLYAPSEGRVLWDGADYRALDPELLRRQMSAAFQDFVRYETTLRDNVGLGLPDEAVPDAAIWRALQLGGGDALARQLPDGLDARLGGLAAGGRELSGGQWQRLAIARAALRDPRLLVLDEPTAALDPQHETELFRSFRALAAGRTALFVSHRLGWARYADRILVLRDGRIVEQGKHETLLAKGGPYAAMFEAQADWYRSG